MKAKISIVVPIYNADEYLLQCLQSIEQQTYNNLEIICIDDGSVDSSFAIAQSFAKRDPRFVVIRKENGGQSSARNMGLENATGEFVMFVDSDDWIEPDVAEGALRTILDTNADCVMWSYMREYGQNKKKKQIFDQDRLFDKAACRDLQRQIIGLSKEELKHPENVDALAPVWSKLLRREIIEKRGLRFTDTSVIGPWEDGFFILQYFEDAEKIAYVDKAWYHYRKGSGVTTVSQYKPKLQEYWENRQKLLKTYIQEHGLDDTYYEALQNRNALNLISLSLNAVALSKRMAYITIRTILRDKKYREDLRAMRLCYLPLKWKVFFLLCRLRCASCVTLLALYMQRAIVRGNTT